MQTNALNGVWEVKKEKKTYKDNELDALLLSINDLENKNSELQIIITHVWKPKSLFSSLERAQELIIRMLQLYWRINI